MSDTFRYSGQKAKLPSVARGELRGLEKSFVPRPGGWIVCIAPDGTRTRLMAVEAKGRLSVSIGGRLHHGEIQSDSRQAGSGGQAGAGDSDLVAQFPGKVRKLLVSEGSFVAEGQSLILVEAMKMEFTIKAPFAAKVRRVLVKEGQQLSPGDRFFDLEAAGG